MRKSLSRIASAFQRKLFVRVCVASGTVIRPGDTLILRTDTPLTDKDLAAVRANFTEKFPGVGFIRLSADSDIVFICHPVGDGSRDGGAEGGGKQGGSQRVTKAPQSSDDTPHDAKNADLKNDGLSKFVFDDLRPQSDSMAATSNSEHVKLPSGQWLRDAIVTDTRENGPMIQAIRQAV